MAPVHDVDTAQLQPIECPELQRLGSPNDGGYVVPVQALQRASALISLGLSIDWNFERDALALNPGLVVHAYDHTVGRRFFARSAALAALTVPFRLLSLSPRRVRKTLRKLARSIDYFRFFRGDVRHFRQRAWFNTDDGSADIDMMIARIGTDSRHSIFLKMDIEGSEYRVLPALANRSELFSGLAIEFHDVDICASAFNSQIRMLRESFEIVHTHGNNYGGLSADGRLPLSLELSLIHKDLLDGPARRYTGALPRAGLDTPNDPSRPDYELRF